MQLKKFITAQMILATTLLGKGAGQALIIRVVNIADYRFCGSDASGD